MDAVAFCGVAKVSRAPRGRLLGRHVIPSRRIGRLVYYNHHPLSSLKIMAKKSLLYFVDPDPYEDNDISIHVDDNVNMANPKAKKDLSRKNLSSKLSWPVVTGHTVVSKEKQLLTENARDELEARGIVTSAGNIDMKLRKPGVVYEDSRRILPKSKSAPSLSSESRSEGMINVTLLEKPEVGKPYRTKSRPDYLTRQVPIDGGVISQSYKPQMTEYELHYSRPVQVSINPKPKVMETKPDIVTPLRSIDKPLEEREYNPKTLYHPNPQKRQNIPLLTSKFTEQVDINLRKPSIPTDDNKTDLKSKPKMNPLLDMQMDSGLSSQADPDSELEQKPSLDNGEDSNPEKRQNVPPLVSKFTEQVGINLRKPSIPTDEYKTDLKPKPKLNPLLDMQMDSGLSSQADPDSELERKPSLDNGENSRNVVIEEERGLNVPDLRKPDVPLDDSTKIDRRTEENPRALLDEHRHDDSDLSSSVLKERGETAITHSSELDLKLKLQSVTEMAARYSREDLSSVLLHKKPKFDVGLQQTNQVGNLLTRNGSSDARSVSSEEKDWIKVEQLLNNSERVIVELTGYNNEGFFATLGSIVGFVPYENLGPQYKFFAFQSWLRKKRADLTYQKKVGNIDNIGLLDSLPKLGIDTKILEENQLTGTPASSTSALNSEDLFHEYQKEKDAFLSSIIGQKLKVTVSVADRSTKKVVFMGKHREYQESLNKKRKLMARLKVGDIVKCRISRFMHFGIFVEVEGVAALIPQAEVHFDDILDLLSSLELGQTLDARVHQLDYERGRITLSLRGVTHKSDPQNDDFESVVGGDTSSSGTLQEAQPEEEWEDVESLIKELEKLEKVNTISKGTFFLSSGLAPTFQVYMAPMVDDRYRLLARIGNKVQEIWVQASMDEETMKSAIISCTSRIAR